MSCDYIVGKIHNHISQDAVSHNLAIDMTVHGKQVCFSYGKHCCLVSTLVSFS